MKPAIFDYYRAETLDHASELLSRYGDDAKILAGRARR
jgi:CO/xanthine dehydrogenase FAD-binding subunit